MSGSSWQEVLGVPPDLLGRVVSSLLVVAVLLAIRFVVLRVVYRRTDDVTRRYHWWKGVSYTVTVTGLIVIARIWFEGLQSFATFFGLLAAGLAIALQDLVANIAGWLFILWRQPFKVGDRIEVGENAGDVIDQRLFMFSLMEVGKWVEADQSTGRVLHIPNSMVFKTTLANYHQGFEYIWDEIPVLVTFESDWKKAKAILRKIAEAH